MLRSRGYNKNSESRYISHIGSGIGVRTKFGDNYIYKTAMNKALNEKKDNKKDDKKDDKDDDKKDDIKEENN